MAKAYIDSVEIGTFHPRTEGRTGEAFINNSEIGVFGFKEVKGKAFIGTSQVGVYSDLVPYDRVLAIPIRYIKGYATIRRNGAIIRTLTPYKPYDVDHVVQMVKNP